MPNTNKDNANLDKRKRIIKVAAVDRSTHKECPRCRRWHHQADMWSQRFEDKEYFVCDRCHKALYFSGWTTDFGIRWWDKEVFLKKYPERDTDQFRDEIREFELETMAISTDEDDFDLLKSLDIIDGSRKEKQLILKSKKA